MEQNSTPKENTGDCKGREEVVAAPKKPLTVEELAELAKQDEDSGGGDEYLFTDAPILTEPVAIATTTANPLCPMNLRSMAYTKETLLSVAVSATESIQAITLLPKPSDLAIDKLCTALLEMRDNGIRMQDPAAQFDKRLVWHYIFTLLVPGGRADKTSEAVKELLNTADVFSLCRIDPTAINILNKHALYAMFKSRVRFPERKADRLLLAMRRWPEVVKLLQQGGRGLLPEAMHMRLQSMVPGFGPKAAAHFMRNVGVHSVDTECIPIVDTHIRKFMELIGETPFRSKYGGPASVADGFTSWCRNQGFPLLLADAVIWMMYSGTNETDMVDFEGANG